MVLSAIDIYSRRTTLFSIVLFLLSTATASAENVDSLKNILETGNAEQKFDALIELSMYYDFNHIDSSIFYTKQLFEHAKHLGDKEKMMIAHRNLGISYDNAGLYNLALMHYQESIAFLDSVKTDNNMLEKAHLIHNVGIIKQELREYGQAKQKMHEALNFKKSLNDSLELITSFYALGSLCWEIGEYDSAIIYLTTTLNLDKKYNPDMHDSHALIESELIQTLIYANNIRDADSLLTKIRQSEYSNEYSLYTWGYIYYNEGLLLGARGLNQRSYGKFDSALILSDSIGLAEEGINILMDKSRIAEEAGDFKTAFLTNKEVLKREREWLSRRKIAFTKVKEVELETKEKEKAILSQKAEISSRENVILIISLIALLIIVLSLVLYRNNRVVNLKNKRIESLIRELHHRVKNNLQVISSLLSLQSMRLEDGEAKAAVEEGRSRIRAMAMIHQNLYLQDDTAEIDTEEYLKKLLHNLSTSYGIPEDKLQIKINKLKLDVDTILPVGLIVNELVSNAFKYAFNDLENAKLEVNFENKGQEMRLFIKDNGRGLQNDIDISQRTSFGLKLVNLLVKQLHGELEVNSDNGLAYDLRFQIKNQAA